MPIQTETKWELLVSGDELKAAAQPREKENVEIKVNNSEIEKFLSQGFKIKKEGAKSTIVFKEKQCGHAFEDEVWTIFYKMGFKTMNKDNKFSVLYSEKNNLSKQLDVVAIDDETCLLIECKEAQQYGTSKSFQKDINEISSFYNGICTQISIKYPNLKFKYIFATKNYIVGQQDKNRMKENCIVHFDYSAILYYKALVAHLGKAAKYQLLGQIFAGQKITKMDLNIPAIRGKMGGLTYYSFLIAPEKLLKIGYVLHKTNANNDYEDLLPSYQRLIKKERLRSVQDFIDKGNFFPNSIIISIDCKNPLTFNPVPKEYNQDDLAKVGILNLPQTYQSAYIIDGQHRLYGYSESHYASTNSIPVVAFENLDKTEQLKLFMEINLNQKAVPKALRNILEIEIYYDSNDKLLAQSALLGNIAKRLGEDTNSPIKGRVIIGEDAGTKSCCLTIENIKLALKQTRFFNKINKSGQITSKGIFDDIDNSKIFNKFYPIILKFMSEIKKQFENEWGEDSFFVKNNIMGAYIRILSDIIGIAYDDDPNCINDISALWNKCESHFETLVLVLSDLSPEERGDIIKEKGAAAQGNVYRKIQMKMFEFDNTFTNPDIEEYYVDHYKNYNDEAKPEILSIKEKMLSLIKESIGKSDNWMRIYLSEQHENDLTSRVHSTNNSSARNGRDVIVNEWDIMDFVDFKKIVSQGTNWTNYFKPYFMSLNQTYNKDKIVSVLDMINSSELKIKNGHKISGTDYNEIHKLCSSMNGD